MSSGSYHRNGDSTIPLCLFTGFDQSLYKKGFKSKWNFPRSNWCPLHLGLSSHSSKQTCVCVPCTLLLGRCRQEQDPPPFASSLNQLIFHSLSSHITYSNPCPSQWRLLDILQFISVFLVLGSQKLETVSRCGLTSAEQ